jgi:hypothetical protein
MVEMTQAEPGQRIDRIATEAFALLGTGAAGSAVFIALS